MDDETREIPASPPNIHLGVWVNPRLHPRHAPTQPSVARTNQTIMILTPPTDQTPSSSMVSATTSRFPASHSPSVKRRRGMEVQRWGGWWWWVGVESILLRGPGGKAIDHSQWERASSVVINRGNRNRLPQCCRLHHQVRIAPLVLCQFSPLFTRFLSLPLHQEAPTSPTRPSY